MWLIDTNVILRYVLGDDKDMLIEATRVIDEGAYTYPEVLAEVVYVLKGVYKISRSEICDTLEDLLEDVGIDKKPAVLKAIKLFRETSIDFVDCLLVGRNHELGEEVFTFDGKMNKRLK